MASHELQSAEPSTGIPRGDVLLISVLLASLLVAFGVDLTAYHRERTPIPDFPLLESRGSVFIGSSEFLPVQSDAFVRLENLTPAYNHRHPLRRGLGPVSTVEIYSSRNQAHINFTYDNPVVDQEITVRCNEEIIEHLTGMPVGRISRSYPLRLRAGSNQFTISYAKYNHGGRDFAPLDSRPIAGSYTALDLFLD